MTRSKLLYTYFGLVQFCDSSEVSTVCVPSTLLDMVHCVPSTLLDTVHCVPGTLLDTVGDFKGARGGAVSNRLRNLAFWWRQK